MPVVYSSLQQTQIDESNYPQYGITKPNETEYSYFQVDFDPLKYCGGHRNMAETDYLFVSTTGNLKDAKFFGKVENYQYSFCGGGGSYASVNWIGTDEDITNFNVPDFRGVVGKPNLPYFSFVGEIDNPLRFFVERPKDEAKTATCFESVKKIFTGSGTKRHRKNKRKSLNKNRKQRKSKRRRTKKNKIRPIIYGGASIKQYGIATALRSLIFTYFPQRDFDTINLPKDSLNKYGLTHKYTTVMDLLNQIVHNDDNKAILPREVKFGDFLTYSQDLDNILSDIISDIKQYFYEPKINNRISPNEEKEISGLINSIQDELVITTGLRSEKELPESASASAQGVIPGKTRIPVASIFPKA